MYGIDLGAGVCEQASNYMRNICIHASVPFSGVTQIGPCYQVIKPTVVGTGGRLVIRLL